MHNQKFKKNILTKVGVCALACVTLAGVYGSNMSTYQAASKDRVSSVANVSKNTELTGGDEPTLIIELTDALKVDSTFYLELENAEWLGDIASGAIQVNVTNFDGDFNFEIDQVDKTMLSITLLSCSDSSGASLEELPEDSVLRINLSTKVGKKNASVNIDGGKTTISSDTIVFAKVSTSGATAKVPETIAIYDEGTLKDLTIEEAYPGAFVEETRGSDLIFTLKLDNNDFDFTSVRNITLTGLKGFEGLSTSGATIRLIDDNEIEVSIPVTALSGNDKGAIKISGLTVTSNVDEPSKGALKIDIDSDSFDSMSVTVANVVKSSVDVKITPTDNDFSSGMIAGRESKYRVVIKESMEDVLVNGRQLTFSLNKGYMLDAGTTKTKAAIEALRGEISLPSEMELTTVTLDDTKITGFTVTVESDKEEIDEYTLKIPVGADLEEVEDEMFNETELKKDTKKTSTKKTSNSDDELSSESDDSGSDNVTFSGGTKSKSDNDDNDSDDETSKKKSSSTVSESDPINLTISGKAIANDEVVTKIADILVPIEVDITEKAYKVGTQGQEGEDIIIRETSAGMIQKGTFFIAFDRLDGISFDKAPTVEVVSGNLKLGKGTLVRNGNEITGVKFNIPKTSTKASEIKISDIKVTVDRTVPQGRTGILVGGSALTKGEGVASKLYANIKEESLDETNETIKKTITDSLNDMQKQNSQLQQQLQMQQQQNTEPALTTVFTIGSTAYTVNGTQKVMTTAPYASQAGRIMVPVKYVADALGIPGDNIFCNNGIVTIMAKNNTTVQFKSGSKVMLFNGAQIPMDEKTIITNGRTFVPVSFAAKALGLSYSYDDTTKTVTFMNDTAKSSQQITTLPAQTQQQVVTQQSTNQTPTTQQSTAQNSTQTTQSQSSNTSTNEALDLLKSLGIQ